jgi:hypothetical protein
MSGEAKAVREQSLKQAQDDVNAAIDKLWQAVNSAIIGPLWGFVRKLNDRWKR